MSPVASRGSAIIISSFSPALMFEAEMDIFAMTLATDIEEIPSKAFKRYLSFSKYIASTE